MKFFHQFQPNTVSRFVFDIMPLGPAREFEGGGETPEADPETDEVSAERVELLDELTASPAEMEKVGLKYEEGVGWYIEKTTLSSLRGSMIDIVGRVAAASEIQNLVDALGEANAKQKDSIEQRALVHGVYETLLDHYMKQNGFTPEGEIVLGHEFASGYPGVTIRYTETGRIYRYTKRVQSRNPRSPKPFEVVHQEFEVTDTMTEPEREEIYERMANVVVPNTSFSKKNPEERRANFIQSMKDFEPQPESVNSHASTTPPANPPAPPVVPPIKVPVPPANPPAPPVAPPIKVPVPPANPPAPPVAPPIKVPPANPPAPPVVPPNPPS